MTTILTGRTDGLRLIHEAVRAGRSSEAGLYDDGAPTPGEREKVRMVVEAIGAEKGIDIKVAARDNGSTEPSLAFALATATQTGVLRGWPGYAEGRSLYAWGRMDAKGRLQPERGDLLAADHAAREGHVFVTPAEAGNVAALSDATIYAARTIGELLDNLQKGVPGGTCPLPAGPAERDLDDIAHDRRALRALEIAAAGRHPLMITGPGMSARRAASRLATLLPAPTTAEIRETARQHSAAGLAWSSGLMTGRCVRAPHFSASSAAIAGGRRASECALAHNGVLILNDIPEFGKQTIYEVLTAHVRGTIEHYHSDEGRSDWMTRFHLVATIETPPEGGLSERDKGLVERAAEDFDVYVRTSGPQTSRHDGRQELRDGEAEEMRQRVEKAIEAAKADPARLGRNAAAHERVAKTISRLDGRDVPTPTDLDEAKSFGAEAFNDAHGQG